MADVTEKFNVEEVKNKMDTLETAFNALSDALSEANKIVNEEVNVGPESALFGELGTVLLNTWNENASTFGDFHANFESWAQIVSVIAANNISFTEETISAYKDNGSTLTYKDDTTGERKSISGLREERAQEQTINYVKNNFPEDKYDITESDNALVIKDKNGNIVVEYSMENGKITSTKWYDSDGNYSVITYEVGEDGKLKKNVTYYDANGNVIEKPSSFYEDGTLRPDLTGSSGDEPTEVVTKTGNLSDLKDGDTVTIGTEECVVSEKNGVRTITLKNGEQIQIMPDGSIKTLYGGEFEINGQKIRSTAYTDEELRTYYAKTHGNESNYIYKNSLGKTVEVTVKDGRTEYKTILGDGYYVKRVFMANGDVYALSVSGGVASFVAKTESGQNVKITYKDVAEYFDESCTSLKYIGMNGHEKTMTKDPNTGYFAVKDFDGTLTCYDQNLNKVDITQTAFDSNGIAMSVSQIAASSKSESYVIDYVHEYDDIEIKNEQRETIYNQFVGLHDQFDNESGLLSNYLSSHESSINDDTLKFLNNQLYSRESLNKTLSAALCEDKENKGLVYDCYKKVQTPTKDKFARLYNLVDSCNDSLIDILSIEDINKVLNRLGYPIIQ